MAAAVVAMTLMTPVLMVVLARWDPVANTGGRNEAHASQRNRQNGHNRALQLEGKPAHA